MHQSTVEFCGANTLSAGARFQVSVSDVNFTSPATNANWEGLGVEPDIVTTRREALTAAHLAALARLGESAADEERRTAYAWGQDVVRARAHPPVSNPRRLAALAGLFALFPLMFLMMLATIMIQVRSFSKMLLVFATGPLGLIGAVVALMVTHQLFGFNAILGLIGIGGILMRNTLILIDQIEQDMLTASTRARRRSNLPCGARDRWC